MVAGFVRQLQPDSNHESELSAARSRIHIYVSAFIPGHISVPGPLSLLVNTYAMKSVLCLGCHP